MKNINTLLLSCFYLLIFTASALAQELQYTCGTVTDASEMERLKRNIRNSDFDQLKSGDITYIPITFHLVAQTNGNGRIAEQPVLDNLCRLNQDFLLTGLQFYKPGEFNYIDNDAIYGGTANSFIIALNKVAGTINVFVGNQIPAQGGGITLGYYTPQGDYLHLAKTAIGGPEIPNSFVFPHEMGHFFSLPHTFLGWDGSVVYVPGTPAPGAVTSASGTWAVEKSVRTGADANCATASDLFCDTPPDYRFGFGWNGPICNYTANALDPLGEPVDPQENNQMSYFFGCQTRQFTGEQTATILADYASRTFNSGTPDSDINAAVNLTYPVNTTVLFSNVDFTWDAVPNATMYQIEINRSSNFNATFIVEKLYVNTNSYSSTILLDNQTYYWRVKPLNNYDFCEAYSSGAMFMTGTPTGVSEFPGLNSFTVHPNPVLAGQSLNVSIDVEQSLETQLKLYTIRGQLIKNQPFNLQAGGNVYELKTMGLPSGVYLLTVENKEGIARKKIVLTN